MIHINKIGMQTRSPFRPSKDSKSRQFMRLPNKLLFISTFFNQKIQNTPQANPTPQINHNHNPIPTSPTSPSTRKQRKDSLHTPKYQLNNSRIHFSFDQQQRPHRRLRAIKHHSLNRDDSISKEDFSSQRMGNTGKKITVFFGENDSFVIDTKRSALLGEEHHEIIKRQLQEKFQRTRLNFKEQQRAKDMSQVGRAVERRHRLLKKITKSEEVGKKKSESQKFEPWMRDKMTKDGVVEMEESGNYEEEF